MIINTNRSASPVPVLPLGACRIAEAAERAGHAVSVLDLLFAQNPLNAVAAVMKRSRYDAVGLSVRNIDNNSMQSPAFYISDLASVVRKIRTGSDAPVILGGPAVSIMPDEILQETGATCAVIGNGTESFLLLLEQIRLNRPLDGLPGIVLRDRNGAAVKTAASEEAGGWRTPDFGRWIDVSAYRTRLATVPIQTKVGCGFRCIYCTYGTIEGTGHSLQDPGAAAEDIQLLTTQGYRDFEFVDSVFNAPLSHALTVCEAIARRRLRVRLQSMDVNPLFMNDELLSAMERAGFCGIGMTVESAAEPVLSGLRKGFTADHVHRAADAVRRHTVPCLWIFMFGGPGETEDTVKETLRFAETEIRPGDAAFFTIGIRVYPGTELESISRKQGVLRATRAEMLAPVFYTSPDVDLRRMESMVKESVRRHMNFMSADSLGFPWLPAIHRLGFRMGLSTPLWRHTRLIRRGLRFVGMDV